MNQWKLGNTQIKMHTKYSKTQVKICNHDYQVKKLHRRKLSFHKKELLTKVENAFKNLIIDQRYKNKSEYWKYFNENINEHVEISIDNWIMNIHAYKNKDAFSEDHKRWERYLKRKYYEKYRPY